MEVKAAYFIYSEQKLLLEEACQRLNKKLYGQEQPTPIRLAGDNSTAEEIIARCQSLSFFGQKQLVIVENCLALSNADKKSLAAYLQNPNHQTVLLLEAVISPAEGKKLSKDPLFQAVSQSANGRVYHYEVKSLSHWIKQEFAKAGKKVLPAVISYLTLTVGEDLLQLKQEIAKIVSYCDKEEVELNDLKEVVVPTAEANVFALIEAIGAADLETALNLANLLLERGEKVDSLVNLIEQQLHLIALFLIYKAEGRAQTEELTKKLGISKGRLYYLKKQAAKFSDRRLQKSLAALLAHDYQRKTEMVDDKVLLEQLVMDLCRN